MSVLRDVDRGTPERRGEPAVAVTVDGLPVSVPAGTSVLRAASLAGIDVPKTNDTLESARARLAAAEERWLELAEKAESLAG